MGSSVRRGCCAWKRRTSRSARRHTERAMWSRAANSVPPGRMKFRRGGSCSVIASICCSSSWISVSEIERIDRLISWAWASSPPRSKRSFWMRWTEAVRSTPGEKSSPPRGEGLGESTSSVPPSPVLRRATFSWLPGEGNTSPADVTHPKMLLSSSTAPIASMTSEVLETRSVPSRPVSPWSPVLV